jgi:hypothetical protein
MVAEVYSISNIHTVAVHRTGFFLRPLKMYNLTIRL